MPSYKAEVAYLKDVIKAYQLAIANLGVDCRSIVTDEKEDKKLDEAFVEMKAIIQKKVWNSTTRHNRTREEYVDNNSYPEEWTEEDLEE
jgi:hypothetical protein